MARGRKPQVRYWPSRKGGGFFTTYKGQQVELALGPDDSPTGPTYLRALDAFGKLLRQDHCKGTDGYALSALLNRYREQLASVEGEGAKAHLVSFNSCLGDLARKYPNLPVADLRPFHFNELVQTKTWNDTTIHNAGMKLLRALNWGVSEGIITSNPLRGKLKLPKGKARGAEARLPADLCRRIIEIPKYDCVRRMLGFLWATGCRPVEVRQANLEHVQGNRIVFPSSPKRGEYRHKTAAKTGRDRVVFIPPSLQGWVEEEREKRKTGPIFLSPRRRKWGPINLPAMFATLRGKPAFIDACREQSVDPDSVTLYCFRHTFISEWVDSGRSIHVLAYLTGTSVAMIEKVYGHPSVDRMAEHYAAFLREDWAGRTEP